MSLHAYRGILPRVDPSAFVAPTAAIIGDVIVGGSSSVWFGAVIRGDVAPIRIGASTSIQDNSVIHSTGGWSETQIGDGCTVGHSVVLHGCTVGDRVLVGMGSIVLDHAEIGSDTILGAGSLVTVNAKIPSGVLAFGRPAKVIRELTAEERQSLLDATAVYQGLVREYLSGA